MPVHPPFTAWHEPVPVSQLRHADVFSWGREGRNKLHQLSLPGHGNYFAKVATDFAHDIKRPLTADRTRHPPAFSEADHDAELTSNTLRRLIGQPDVVPMAEFRSGGPLGGLFGGRFAGFLGDRHIVTPKLSGHNLHDLIRHMTGEPDANPDRTRHILRKRSGVKEALKQIGRSIPKEKIGAMMFGDWFVNRGDPHANNHIWEYNGEGEPANVHEIDGGSSVWPRKETEHHWDTHHSLRTVPEYEDHEWDNIPIPRHMAENAIRKAEVILNHVRYYGRHLDRSGPYSRHAMMEHYRNKLDFVRRVLKEKSGGPLALGDFGIDGYKYSPRVRRMGPSPGFEGPAR